jgi:nucleoside 2-deoxyribosyltransferase
MIRVYLAGPWKHRLSAAMGRSYLRHRGIDVVSNWTDVDDTKDSQQLQKAAQQDWNELQQADVLVLLNLAKSEGKAVEFGSALQRGIRVIVVQPDVFARSHIFMHLPQVEFVTTLVEAADRLLIGEA